MRWARIVLWIAMVSFVLFGLGYLLVPEPFAEGAGIGLATASGTTDIRATYGGFQIGFGLFLLGALRHPERTETAIRALVLVLGGIGACRLIGLGLGGGWSHFHALALLIEIPGTAAAATALARLRSEG